MRKLLLILMCVFANLYVVNAQGNELIIRKPLRHWGGYSGEVQKDRNGNPCARVEVTVTRKVEIEGEYIMGDVEESMGKYSFRVVPPSKPNTKFITIRTEGLLPITIDLWANGKLIGGEVYEAEIDAPANVVSQEELEEIEAKKEANEQARIENERKEQELKRREEELKAKKAKEEREWEKMKRKAEREKYRIIRSNFRRQKLYSLGENTVWYSFLGYEFSMKSNLGLMYGRCKGLGFYVKAKINSKGIDYSKYEDLTAQEGWFLDENTNLYYYKTEDTEKYDDLTDVSFNDKIAETVVEMDTLKRNGYAFGIKCSQVSTGMMFRLGTDVVYLSLGIGYEKYNSDGYEYKKIKRSGVCFDTDLILRFDKNRNDAGFLLIAGYSSQFYHLASPNFHFGLGVSF